MIRRVIGLFALAAAQAALAQTPVQQSNVVIPLGLSQKHEFARSLIEDVATVKRIQDSQDTEAQRLLSLAGESYSNALAALKDGEFDRAEKQFNESMSAIGKARRRVPDVAAFNMRQRTDYQRLLEGLESMEKSYLGYLKRANQPVAAGKTEERVIPDVDKLMETARMHAQENRMADALQALERAEQVIKPALGRLLGSATIVYVQQFASLAEEFDFELERNRSHLDLIPVAIAELRPTEDTKQTIESLVEQDLAAVDLASEYAGLQDYEKALAHVRAGTSYLQLALIAAGLVLPKGAGAE